MRRTIADIGARTIPPLLLAPIGALVVIVSFWVPIRLSMPDAHSTTATVVEKYLSHMEDATFNTLRYTFNLDGRDFTGTSEVLDATYARTRVGDSLTVRYAESDPSVNRYVVDQSVATRELTVGGLWLIVTASLPLAWWRQRTRRATSAGYPLHIQAT